MKKTNLIKGILLILLSVVLIGTNGVYAADSLEGEIDDLMDFSSSNTSSNTSNTSSSTNTSTSSNTSNNTSVNTNTNKTNTTNSTNTNKTNNTTSNSSVYNNTNSSSLPKTGVEDSIPTMVLVVVFAISAVYAFKKIKEYNV